MESLYLLNNHVYFNPIAGMLSSSLCFSRNVMLSKPASHCLKLLISRQGEICHYTYLSHQIWGDRGKWISNNTIHQHIYQLRNHLKKAGIEKPAIITIPRQGFQLCPQFTVAPIAPAEGVKKINEEVAILRGSVEQHPPTSPVPPYFLYSLVAINTFMTLLLSVKCLM